ncbi:biliverdin-producing heme oxygenase [Glycomyces sp. L485]|uniref:biliverdin-producing heme oxygenase n=1 Tax=Glycomyces sp. L485 TaxID=2909235 RepID=UPI001F4AA6D6|nr:biliverdin-producing heme oxygenase [Glycomyces sp. L485]MCH7230629.1 biliverdin-producing heme oxygenase [Glycomyces sp. L485]
MSANSIDANDVETLPFSGRIRRASWSRHQSLDPGSDGSDRAPGVFDRLFDGTLTIGDYARWHAQQFFVYEAIESAAERWRGHPVAGAFVFDELLRLDAITEDLEFLIGPDWRPKTAPLAATRRYVERIEASAHTWAGGYIAHSYTRYLGDLSGGQAFGKAARRVFGFDGRGAGFYDFAAVEDTKAFKDLYRARLDAAALDAGEQDRVIDEVLLAYDHNGAVLEALASQLSEEENPFDADVIAAICRHMNDDHAADTLVMCRGLGGRPEATAARMTGLDGEGGDYAVTAGGVEESIRIPWARRLTERDEVRPEVVRIFTESRELLRHAGS